MIVFERTYFLYSSEIFKITNKNESLILTDGDEY